MRELTLIETGHIAGLLVLSLVLPMMMSFFGPRNTVARGNCMRTVWTAQAIGAGCGFVILLSKAALPYGAIGGITNIVFAAIILRQQIHSARFASSI